jgi:hypothetical protein
MMKKDEELVRMRERSRIRSGISQVRKEQSTALGRSAKTTRDMDLPQSVATLATCVSGNELVRKHLIRDKTMLRYRYCGILSSFHGMRHEVCLNHGDGQQPCDASTHANPWIAPTNSVWPGKHLVV